MFMTPTVVKYMVFILNENNGHLRSKVMTFGLKVVTSGQKSSLLQVIKLR